MMPQFYSGIISDALFESDHMTPDQYMDTNNKSHGISPERQLILSVLEQAVYDLGKFRFAKMARDQRHYLEAYRWVASNDRTWPYSFINVCETLGFSQDSLREELLGVYTPHPEADIDETPFWSPVYEPIHDPQVEG